MKLEKGKTNQSMSSADKRKERARLEIISFPWVLVAVAAGMFVGRIVKASLGFGNEPWLAYSGLPVEKKALFYVMLAVIVISFSVWVFFQRKIKKLTGSLF